MARRRTNFQGLQPQATKELVGLQDELIQDTKDLRREVIGSTTDTKQSGTHGVKFSERVRLRPVAAGIDLVFPGAAPTNQNRWIELLILSAGTIRIRATSGLVQGAALLTLTNVGFYYFQSDGTTGWLMQPLGGSIADGVYGSITVSGGGTIWRVTDGVYGSVTVSGGGLIWTVAGSSVTMTDVSVTVAFGSHSAAVVVVDAAIGAASKIMVSWGQVAASDENHPDSDDVTFTATALAGGMVVRVSSDNAPVGGAYKIRYLLG